MEIDSAWAAALPCEVNKRTPTSLCLGSAAATWIPVLRALNCNGLVAVRFLSLPFLMNMKGNVP